jgi:hypothetical protein
MPYNLTTAHSRLKRVDVYYDPSAVKLESAGQAAGMSMAIAPSPSVFRGRIVDTGRPKRLDIRKRNQQIRDSKTQSSQDIWPVCETFSGRHKQFHEAGGSTVLQCFEWNSRGYHD